MNTLRLLLIPLLLALVDPVITYDDKSVRLTDWELDYAIKLCKPKGGIDFIDAYIKGSNFVTCKSGVTYSMDMEVKHL